MVESPVVSLATHSLILVILSYTSGELESLGTIAWCMVTMSRYLPEAPPWIDQACFLSATSDSVAPCWILASISFVCCATCCSSAATYSWTDGSVVMLSVEESVVNCCLRAGSCCSSPALFCSSSCCLFSTCFCSVSAFLHC